VFGSINRRIYGIGLTSVYASLVIVTYYIVIIAWAVFYFFATFFGQHWEEGSKFDRCKEDKQSAA